MHENLLVSPLQRRRFGLEEGSPRRPQTTLAGRGSLSMLPCQQKERTQAGAGAPQSRSQPAMRPAAATAAALALAPSPCRGPQWCASCASEMLSQSLITLPWKPHSPRIRRFLRPGQAKAKAWWCTIDSTGAQWTVHGAR